MKNTLQKAMTILGAASLAASFTLAAQAQTVSGAVPAAPVQASSSGFDTASAQVQLVWSHLQEGGHHNFIILDKKNAVIRVVENGNEILKAPALIGKVRGDDHLANPAVTPAGRFDMELVPSDTQGGSVVHFLCEKLESGLKGCYSIHSTVGASRLARYGNAQLAAISNGCVNMLFENYVSLADFMERHKTDKRAPIFIVLPQSGDLVETRSMFNIPVPRMMVERPASISP